MYRSLTELFSKRLGEPEAYVHIVQESCELLIRRERPAKPVSERELMDIARYVQDNFHVNLGVVTLLDPLQNDRLPDMAHRFVKLLHEPRLFDRPVLVLDEKGNYCNECLNMLRSALAIRLPVCSDRDGILALKIQLDQYPGELEGSFRRLLRNAAPLLKSLNLPLSQQGLWGMTQCICENAEERLRQASPKIRQEIYRAMAYMQAHMTENIRREQIGKIVNYDSAHFSKRFKSELGMSYTDYLLHVRMLRAQELLSETDMPISYIVTQCGYTDFSYFSGRFRQFCGVTPHEWRENRREAMV
jgi:AraC-like DNA-binding protein